MGVWSKLKIVKEAIKVVKDPYKYFTEEQIAEAVKLFYQAWDGNIVRSAKRFVELAQSNPKLVKAEGSLNVGILIGLFIFILIGIVLLPVITSEVTNLTSGTSPQVTGTDATLLQLVPLFYILVLIIVPAVIAYKIYKE
ncbi:A138 [Sulfolobus spindle-shaped virus Lassen]|nr:A138 [Sulfolobus spindle-shaped virus Lassen]